MLTRFFGTSKPLAVVVVIIYMTLGFFYSNRQLVIEPFNWQETLRLVGMWLLFISTMFILNFVAQKNDLTKRSTYGVLLFAAFSLALPAALRDGAILLAGFFILIALRRIISFKSELYMERKIFDATLWILLAAISFYFSWLYLIAIYIALLLYNISNPRYLIIPLIAIISFAVIYYSFLLLQAGSPADVDIVFESVSFDFKAYNELETLTPIAFFIALLLWTVWRYLGEQRNASSGAKSRYSVILGLLAVGLLVITLSAHKTGAEWYLIVPVMTIIVSNFLEHTESPIFKESLLWLIVLLPVFINYIA
ncbi:hypothetical protein MED134_09456 [Dokdonia sp. MED134]|uniref:DUF6427 family protein n=1 Tax=Dokdonia sp. MED134 TaxID=313590 RepID=UPI0001F81551|nr:DUF6427 family protein [Dokdonia sp. MED134]EAQ39708.2 hypothetical protein MED134_09456 [Dokdonia sp. MED134]